MPATISMPTPVFILFLVLMLYIVFKNDRPQRKKILLSAGKSPLDFRRYTEEEFYNKQIQMEKMQIGEYN